MITQILKMLLLRCCWISGVTAKEPPVTHYRLINSSVCLHVRQTPSYANFKWTFDKKLVVVGNNLNENYMKKMVFSQQNLTLCLNELTESDSGDYEASFISNFTEMSVRHQLVVQGNVPRPAMVVRTENPSNLSAASCRITVNCSIQDDWLGSVCDEGGCRPPQKSFNSFNITVLFDNTTVVCSGNNHVSTQNRSESLATLCFIESNPKHTEESKPHPSREFIIIPFVIILCVFVAFAIRHFSCKQQPTTPALLIQSEPLETRPHSEPRGSTSSSSEAEPSYENVDISQPGGSSSIPRGRGFRDSQGADTVYNFPTAIPVRYDSGKDRAGHANSEKASKSESATEDKGQGSAQIDTVYTMLQLPKNVKPQLHPEDA